MAEKREVNAEIEAGSSCLDLEEKFIVKQLETGSDFFSIETTKDVNLFGLQDKIEYAGDGNSSTEKNLMGNEENDNGDNHVDLIGLRSRVKYTFLGNSFQCCPWKTFHRPGVLNLIKLKVWTKDNSNIPSEEVLDKVLKVQEVNKDKIQNPHADKVQVTWIGHATVLVQFDGISVLSDPVFLDYCGSTSFASYKRYRKAACKIEDIPKVDAVIISHDHYDHLETSAVKEINRYHSEAKWFVTLKQGNWLIKTGVNPKSIVELDWWGEKKINLNGRDFIFACTPTQHWCGRKPPIDQCKTLWCSWVIKGPSKSYYFAGATGYYERLFQTIGKKYGPFDLAAIPIGAYEPRFITKFEQVDPQEAVKIHQDVKSKQSIGMHWGTFVLTNEFFLEPPQEVDRIMKERGKDPSEFISLCHGETWRVGDKRERPPFMDYKQRKGNNWHSDTNDFFGPGVYNPDKI